MKSTMIISVLLLLAACGKDENKPSKFNDTILEERGSRNEYIDTSSVKEVDLLNVTVSEQVQISGERITFPRQISLQDQGRNIACTLVIKSGESWIYQMSGSSLELILPDETRFTLEPITKNQQGLNGSWVWNGSMGETKISRRYTFLPNRVVINQDCEG